MKKLLIPLMAIIALPMFTYSCRFAPKNDPGDTIAASVFSMPDTAAINRKARAKAARDTIVNDSADIKDSLAGV